VRLFFQKRYEDRIYRALILLALILLGIDKHKMKKLFLKHAIIWQGARAIRLDLSKFDLARLVG
jgi:hypothetical protein